MYILGSGSRGLMNGAEAWVPAVGNLRLRGQQSRLHVGMSEDAMDAEEEQPEREEASALVPAPGAHRAHTLLRRADTTLSRIIRQQTVLSADTTLSRILRQEAFFSSPEMDEFRRRISSTALQVGASDAMRRAIVGLPKPFELPAFKFTTDFSNLITGASALSGILAAQEASMRLRSDVLAAAFGSQLSGADSAMGRFREQIACLTSTSSLVEAMALSVRDFRFPMLIERSFAVSNQGWDEATRAIVQARNPDRLFPLQALGRATAGVVASGILLGGRVEEDETAEESAALLGPQALGDRLRKRLGELSDDLPARLDGAWERVSTAGPDAGSQAAHSLMELLDWTLRIAAPDDEVLTWHRDDGRLADELHNDKPTRVLRAKYLLRDRPEEVKAARLYFRAITDLVEVIQSLKHKAGNKDVDAVARLIPTVEGLLIFVLL